MLKLNEGTVYTSLLRLQQQGWIHSDWGVSENNRKAKFYSITKRGLKQLATETENREGFQASLAESCVWRGRNSHDDILDSSTCVQTPRALRPRTSESRVR